MTFQQRNTTVAFIKDLTWILLLFDIEMKVGYTSKNQQSLCVLESEIDI